MAKLKREQDRRIRNQRAVNAWGHCDDDAIQSQTDAFPDTSSDEYRAVAIDEACDLLVCSARTIWRNVDAGLLPQPFRVGRKSAWPLRVLLAFRDSMAGRRRKAAAGVRDALGRFRSSSTIMQTA